MNNLIDARVRATSPERTSPERLLRLVGWSAYASGAVSALGITFFIAMLAFRGPFGRLNDICVIFQYLLALPIPFALHRLLGHPAPRLSQAGMLAGIAGMLAVVALQILLVAGVLTFEQQVGWVMFAMLVVVGAWLAVVVHLARTAGCGQRALEMGLLAWSYVAYPVAAFWLARRLLSRVRSQLLAG